MSTPSGCVRCFPLLPCVSPLPPFLPLWGCVGGVRDMVTVTPRDCSPGMSHCPLAPVLFPPACTVWACA